MFALGFTAGIVAGILLCIFSATLIRRTPIAQQLEDRIIDPENRPQQGSIVQVAEVEKDKKIQEGVSLDDAIDELND